MLIQVWLVLRFVGVDHLTVHAHQQATRTQQCLWTVAESP